MGILPRILLTVGEPAGIGSDIILKIAQLPWTAELVVVGDPALLNARAQQLQLPIQIEPCYLSQAATFHQPGLLKIIPVELAAPCHAGKLNSENAAFVIQCLELATDYCLQRKADALVTGPVHKAILNTAGISFSGHTEFLEQRCNVKKTIMLFIVDKLKIALATTHIPLAEVPKKITIENLVNTIRLLNTELQKYFGCTQPHILVSGLNPHAGEAGYLGREEIEVINPALALLRSEKINVTGPLPADTIFTEKYLKSADAIFAMYHDQALPVIKYIGFDRAVNMTLGLPIIRTSVDHGTALDIAGTGLANAGSLSAAIQLAIELSAPHHFNRIHQ
jgi:4-hydroxythreonine-4-phosphate dehydrogenase